MKCAVCKSVAECKRAFGRYWADKSGGEGPRFISLDSGEVLEFPNWAQVFEFVKAHFDRRNTAGNGDRKKV